MTEYDNAIETVIEENSDAVEDYYDGDSGALNFLVGQVMQETGGSMNPVKAANAIKERLQDTSLPDEGDEVFVTVGTALPEEDRALIRGTAVRVEKIVPETFSLDHEEVLSVGSYDAEFERPTETLEDSSSGPYGPGMDEEYGEVWAYTKEELQ